jgi:transcriptional antiterminator RfaH
MSGTDTQAASDSAQVHDWHLVHTKVRQERCAKENLERQGLTCYMPEVRAERLRRGTLAVFDEPLFPRYLFIRVDNGLESRGWGAVRSTLGVSRLVTFGNQPAKVSDALVRAIRSRAQDSAIPQPYFAVGQQLQVTEGPFVGIDAVYQMADAQGRVMVLLDILSRPVRLSISPASLQRVG